MWETWFRAFLHDTELHVILLLIVVDFILGIIAAFAEHNFRLSYVSDFLRNDLLFKVVPFFVVYAASKAAGHTDAVIPGLDFGLISGGAFAIVVAAMVGSILSSLKTLGLMKNLSEIVAGKENAAPPKD